MTILLFKFVVGIENCKKCNITYKKKRLLGLKSVFSFCINNALKIPITLINKWLWIMWISVLLGLKKIYERQGKYDII